MVNVPESTYIDTAHVVHGHLQSTSVQRQSHEVSRQSSFTSGVIPREPLVRFLPRLRQTVAETPTFSTIECTWQQQARAGHDLGVKTTGNYPEAALLSVAMGRKFFGGCV